MYYRNLNDNNISSNIFSCLYGKEFTNNNKKYINNNSQYII